MKISIPEKNTIPISASEIRYCALGKASPKIDHRYSSITPAIGLAYNRNVYFGGMIVEG